MRKNKKAFISKLVSLALCAVACLAVGTVSLLKTNKVQAESVVITEMHTLSGFKIDEEAAIRREDPVGIRFTTQVSEAQQQQIAELLKTDNVVYGTLILPADLLVGDELTHNTPSVVKGEPNEWKTATKYTVVLGGKGGADLGESYYSRPIAARSYALNAETGEVYYTENTTIRSIGYVAYKAVNDESDPEMHANVVKIAESASTTKELVFNESVSIYNSENSGSNVIANGANKQSANVFAFKIGGIVDKDAVVAYTTSDNTVIEYNEATGVLTAVGEGISTVTGTYTVGNTTYTCTQNLSTTNYAPSTQYKILVSDKAGEYEMQAAKKLQSVLHEATGIRLAIVTESGGESTFDKYISIGETELAQKTCALSELKDLEGNAFTKDTATAVRTVGNTIFIRGMIERATLYGVQRILKDTVGYEYFLKDTYVVDKKTEFVIGDKDYIPDIEYEVIQQQTQEDGIVGPEHAAPAYTSFIVPVGADGYMGITHNSLLVVPDGVNDTSSYKNNSNAWKEWYATNSSNSYLTSDGQKVELCYTAHGSTEATKGRPALVEKVASTMLTWMQKDEYKEYDRVAFSQADQTGWCTCSACTKEGNPSDNLLHFLLDVAASLKTKLENAGDSRADTFKICTLFYNATNTLPKSTASYAEDLKNYMSHMEFWFADIQADYMLPLNDTTVSVWNKGAKENFDQWATFANSNGADLFWWGYYASVACGFIPYDSFEALRANYKLAYDNGVDYMFNQAIGYNVNWTRLKQYLMSELRWNVEPTDDEWTGWIADYMEGAFGPGATAMNSYFEAWRSWAKDNQGNFINNANGTSKSVGKDLRLSTYMKLDTLTTWLNYCNQAIAALDVNDPNYEIYYNNIILERLTPLYLIMYVHGKYEEKFNWSSLSHVWQFSNSANVTPYGQDFLDGIALWNVTYDGEEAANNNQLPAFKTAIQNVLKSTAINNYLVESERQNMVTGTSITLKSANIASGESYTATLSDGTNTTTATGATANDGSVTLTFASAPTAGVSYKVTLTSTAGKRIVFYNVFLVTGLITTYADFKTLSANDTPSSSYYLLTSDIVADGVTLSGTARKTFSGILDGNGYTVSNLKLGINALYAAMSGATVKNINLDSLNASGPIFTPKATDTTFENVTVSILGKTEKTFATAATNVTYTNVKTTCIEGTVIDKTFFIPMGENEVLLEDSNLAKGNYTVIVDGVSSTATAFKNGQLEVSVNSLEVGETAYAICKNSTNTYVYTVKRITKFIKTFDELTALAVAGDASATAGNDAYGYYVLANDIDGKGAIANPGYNHNNSHFQGTLDGNGHTVKNFVAGQCGILGGLKNATVKNINFDFVALNIMSDATGYNYGAVIAGNATNSVFENVSVRFMGYRANVDYTNNAGNLIHFYAGTLVSESSTGVSYKDVTIDLSLCTDKFVASQGSIFGAKVNGLVCENVTVKVDLAENEVDFGHSDNEVTALGTPDGVTVETVNNEVETVYQNDEETGLPVPYYLDDVTEFGFEEDAWVQVYNGNGEAAIMVDSTQYDYVEVDLYIEPADNAKTAFFFLRTYKDGNNVNGDKAYVVDPSNLRLWDGTAADREIQVFDANGKAINTIMKPKTLYTLRVGIKVGEIDKITIQQTDLTIYLANVRFGVEEVVEVPENAPIYSTDGDHKGEFLSHYTGDETVYGWENGTYVFEAGMTNSWNDRAIFNVDSTKYDYMDVEFVVTEGLWYFNAWVVNSSGMLDGNYLVAENTTNSAYGNGYAPHQPKTGENGGKTRIQVLNTSGSVVTGGRTLGTRYVLRVYLDDESLTQLHVGQDNTTILFANVTFGNFESVVSGGTNASAVTKYDGSVTDLGFTAGSTVYKYVGTDSVTDKASIAVNSVLYDYVDVEFVIGAGDRWFFGYALKNGNYLNDSSAYVIDPSNLRIASGVAMDRTIQVFNTNGNAIDTMMNVGERYTLRVYIEGVDQIMIGQSGSTIYLANVTFGNGVAIEKPTEVVKNGSGQELPQYTGTNSTIGFADSDYVFVQETTSSWNHRAHVGNNSSADFVVFDFSITNPSNLTIWFTRNWAVQGGYSNIVTATGYVGANECAARTIYVFDENNVAATTIEANKKYTMWVYLGGEDSFHGVAIGNDNATIYYANVRYVSGTGENIMRQGDTNALLPQYTGNVTDIGFEAGTFVQPLVGTNDSWEESIYTNRARITADGKQDYIAVDFVVQNALSGSYIFQLWANSGNGSVSKAGECSALTTSIVDQNGFSVASVVAGERYTLRVYDPNATYLAIGAYCNNTIYFANVTYGTGELEEPYALLDGNSELTTFTGDATTLGFGEGEYVQQVTCAEFTTDYWWSEGSGRDSNVDLPAAVGQYVSIMFSLPNDFNKADGELFHVWCRNGEEWGSNFGVTLDVSTNARILGTNGEVVTDKLTANTVYMLELYADNTDRYQVGYVAKPAATVSFATKSIKNYTTSIASSPITGSRDATVTVHYGTEELGFDRNEVVKRLETETVSNIWSDTQPTIGLGRASWLINVASEAGKKVTIRFALSQDFNATGTLFYVWAYSDNDGTCPANGSVTLSGSSAMTATITDEAGNAVTELKAYQVYELTLYCDTAIKYDVANMVADGMITYVSSEVTYEAYAG